MSYFCHSRIGAGKSRTSKMSENKLILESEYRPWKLVKPPMTTDEVKGLKWITFKAALMCWRFINLRVLSALGNPVLERAIERRAISALWRSLCQGSPLLINKHSFDTALLSLCPTAILCWTTISNLVSCVKWSLYATRTNTKGKLKLLRVLIKLQFVVKFLYLLKVSADRAEVRAGPKVLGTQA